MKRRKSEGNMTTWTHCGATWTTKHCGDCGTAKPEAPAETTADEEREALELRNAWAAAHGYVKYTDWRAVEAVRDDWLAVRAKARELLCRPAKTPSVEELSRRIEKLLRTGSLSLPEDFALYEPWAKRIAEVVLRHLAAPPARPEPAKAEPPAPQGEDVTTERFRGWLRAISEATGDARYGGPCFHELPCIVARIRQERDAAIERDELEAVKRERDDLRAWKESAMESMGKWDIVRAELSTCGARLGAEHPDEAIRILREQKVEIEKLRGETERWQRAEVPKKADAEKLRGENEKLRAEVATLRASQPEVGKSVKPRCPKYWFSLHRQCILEEGHDGVCMFPTPAKDIVLP